jgi:hypothetical protein
MITVMMQDCGFLNNFNRNISDQSNSDAGNSNINRLPLLMPMQGSFTEGEGSVQSTSLSPSNLDNGQRYQHKVNGTKIFLTNILTQNLLHILGYSFCHPKLYFGKSFDNGRAHLKVSISV